MHYGYFRMYFGKYFFQEHIFYRTPSGDCFRYLENWTFKHLILNKFFHLNQYYYHAIFDHDLMCRNDPQNFKNIIHA